MATLDPTEQRILGVLIEKELSVPGSYPMSENALVDGCNQKSNRDPVMELAGFQVAGALMALQEKGWVARIEGGGRVAKYRHRAVDRLALQPPELAVMAELLVRGAQAAGALKPRVQRMGFDATPEQIAEVLHRLASRPEPLVEQLPLAPRERDRRWRHLLGPAASTAGPAAVAAPPTTAASATLVPFRKATPEPDAPAETGELQARVEALEHAVADLRRQLGELQR